MTVHELSQYYYLKREIDTTEQRLSRLKAKAGYPASPLLTGMPGAPHDGSSPVEKIVADIVDIEATLAAKQIQCIHELARLERYIASVPDSQIRLALSLRYVECLTWEGVADGVGGPNTEDSVKKMCYRYLRKTEQDKT